MARQYYKSCSFWCDYPECEGEQSYDTIENISKKSDVDGHLTTLGWTTRGGK